MTFSLKPLTAAVLLIAAAPIFAAKTETTPENASEKITTLEPIDVVDSKAKKTNEKTDYYIPHTMAGTKTDTPIFDTPMSIKIIPQAILNDQKPFNFKDVLENISGVRAQPSLGTFNNFVIRGFRTSDTFRNGMRADYTDFDRANIERIEVLKGPAAMLYGRIDPGGLVNVVTKKPQAEAAYSIEQEFGMYDYYKTSFDATGALTDDKSLQYRFTGTYQNNNSFRDYLSNERYQVYGSLLWKISNRTEVSIDIEGLSQDYQNDFGIPAIGKRPASVPISFSAQDPNDPIDHLSNVYLGLNLKHEFNDNWKINHRFMMRRGHGDSIDLVAAPSFDPSAFDETTHTLSRNAFLQDYNTEEYGLNLDLIGKFNLWDSKHETLVGFDYYHWDWDYTVMGDYNAGDPALALDIFNPKYGVDKSFFSLDRLRTRPDTFVAIAEQYWYGAYFQDHITLFDKLHILGGGRYDWIGAGNHYADPGVLSFDGLNPQLHKSDAFTPRVGILYQPLPWLSVYGSYTESFAGNTASPWGSKDLPPENGVQYETGIKLESPDKKLTATFAYYHLTKNNMSTPNLASADPYDSIAVGRARSEGVELDFSGQITDRLNVLANYAYTDAKIRKDNSGLEGNRMDNVPRNSGSVWLKYDFKELGMLDGFSMGLGTFAASQRMGDLQNTFTLPGYVRLDAYGAYRMKLGKSNITAQLNVRNLLDKHYYDSTEPFSNSHPRLAIFPASPLMVMGTLKVEF